MRAQHLPAWKLAQRSGVSVNTLSRILAGEDVRLSTLAKVAPALRVSVAWLVGGNTHITQDMG